MTYPLLDEDPLDTANWAAFQSWDPKAGRGALLVYRQDSTQATRSIKLRNVPAGTYRLYAAPEESSFTTHTAAALEAGIPITLSAIRTAAVYRIERVTP
jgi:hypothetical protein